jgi:hypothetical protein
MTSSNVINGQVHTRQVNTNIQYQIVGVYTPFRTNLTRRLAQLKFDKQIEAYWTSDGRIFVKRTETSRKEIVTNFDDIAFLPILDLIAPSPLIKP